MGFILLNQNVRIDSILFIARDFYQRTVNIDHMTALCENRKPSSHNTIKSYIVR